jgi:hypothetical protein
VPIKLTDLRPIVETVHAAGCDIPVHPLRLGDLCDLIGAHKSLAAAFMVPAENRGGAIVQAVLAGGREVVADVIDAAIRWERGSAAQAPFSGLDEARIITKAVEISLPSSDLEKLTAEAGSLLERLGLRTSDAG